jgi:hypothetical protein
MNSKKDLEDLKMMTFDLISDLELIFTEPAEISDLSTITFFYKRLHAERIMNYTIKKLLPHKQEIETKNIKFFETNSSIFSELPEDRFGHYKNIFLNTKRLSKDDMDTIWEYLRSMSALAESYSKSNNS